MCDIRAEVAREALLKANPRFLSGISKAEALRRGWSEDIPQHFQLLFMLIWRHGCVLIVHGLRDVTGFPEDRKSEEGGVFAAEGLYQI